MELVGFVCDGENDLGTEGTRREPGPVPSAPREKPDCGPRAGSQGAPDQPAPEGELETKAVDKAESALDSALGSRAPGPAKLPKGSTLKSGQVKGEAARLGPVNWAGLVQHLCPQGLSHPRPCPPQPDQGLGQGHLSPGSSKQVNSLPATALGAGGGACLLQDLGVMVNYRPPPPCQPVALTSTYG